MAKVPTGNGTLDDPLDYGEPAPYGRHVESMTNNSDPYVPNPYVQLDPWYQYVPNSEPLLDEIESFFAEGKRDKMGCW